MVVPWIMARFMGLNGDRQQARGDPNPQERR
jgi:hypothetical protein